VGGRGWGRKKPDEKEISNRKRPGIRKGQTKKTHRAGPTEKTRKKGETKLVVKNTTNRKSGKDCTRGEGRMSKSGKMGEGSKGMLKD